MSLQMFVFSVLIEDQVTGASWFEGPFLAEWMATDFATKTHLEHSRTIYKWQMLNASIVEGYPSSDSPSNPEKT